MAISVGGKSGGTMCEMNVIPLIDILLVLIIIFMVITPTIPKGLDTLVPQPNPNPQQPQQDVINRTVVVQVEAGGALKINEEPHTWESLGKRLEDIFKTRAEKVAFVKGHPSIAFSEVARAIDVMKASGIDKVGLITPKAEAGQ
jgi:biopolymer transport protein ExbD